MKRRTSIFITIVTVLLFLTTLPVSAGANTVKSSPPPNEAVKIHQVMNTNLLDILNNLPVGNHDQSSGNQNQFSCLAEGWATDPDDRSIDLNVRILSDGVEVAQTLAGVFRPDLADADICTDGTCSFSVNLWGLISPDSDHWITEQAQDAQTGEWVNLYDTPKMLNCSEVNILPEGFHDAAEGVQNQFSCVAEGWTTDPNDRNIDLNVRILSDGIAIAQTVAAVFRQDLDEAGMCPGATCSFSVNLWGLI